MVSNSTVDLGAVWLTDGFLAQLSDDTNRFALDRIRREIDSGATSLDGAVRALSGTRRPQPGEFGVELIGSAVLVVLLPALKTFFDRYVQKVIEGAADRAASLTLDQLKKLFRRDLEDQPELIRQELEKAFTEHGQVAGISPESAARFIELIRDQQKLATVAQMS